MQSVSLQKQAQELDHIIDISIIKLRRLQIIGCSPTDIARVQILSTLRGTILAKVNLLRSQGILQVESTIAFSIIIQDCLQRLGLSRLLSIRVEYDDINDIPKLIIPLNNRRLKIDF
jgi:hypothetical protein